MVNVKNEVGFAEMDAPISIVEIHPYGRRRAGTNGQVQVAYLNTGEICAVVFILAIKVQI